MKKQLLWAAAVFLCFACKSTDPALKYPNMVENIDPFSLGTIEVFFDQIFSSPVKAGKVEVIFHPRENTVSLEFKYDLTRFRQFWDHSARQIFIEALKQYNDDFTDKKLVAKYNKSRAIYGKVKSQIEWETAKFTTTYRAAPLLELGYRFKGENPYFTVRQRSGRDKTMLSNEKNMESLPISLYYTRAQGEKLAHLFNQDFLREMAIELKSSNTGE